MSPPPVRPDRKALFLGFLGVGVYGFGGVLPWTRRMIVEQRRWMTAAEFTDLLSLCQFLPGPNVINVSIALGARFHGWSGSLAAFSGLMAAPMVIVIALGALYERYGGYPTVRHAFAGLSAAASALVLSTALKIALPLRAWPAGIAVGVVTLLAIVVFRLPLLLVLAIMGPVSIVLAHRAQA
mgnify:CR=1 FL=1|jgi:chromate transporter